MKKYEVRLQYIYTITTIAEKESDAIDLAFARKDFEDCEIIVDVEEMRGKND